MPQSFASRSRSNVAPLIVYLPTRIAPAPRDERLPCSQNVDYNLRRWFLLSLGLKAGCSVTGAPAFAFYRADEAAAFRGARKQIIVAGAEPARSRLSKQPLDATYQRLVAHGLRSLKC